MAAPLLNFCLRRKVLIWRRDACWILCLLGGRLIQDGTYSKGALIETWCLFFIYVHLAVRRVTQKRNRVEGNFERRDVIKDYSSYDSQTYAPMSRVGVFLDRGSEQYVVKSSYLSTYQGLLELEASLPDFVTRPRVQAPRPKSARKDGFVKRKQRRQQELDEVSKVIELSKRPAELPKPLRFLEKVEKPVPRPPTPSVQVPSQVRYLHILNTNIK